MRQRYQTWPGRLQGGENKQDKNDETMSPSIHHPQKMHGRKSLTKSMFVHALVLKVNNI